MADPCGKKDCQETDCKTYEAALDVMKLLSTRGLTMSEAAVVARYAGYSILMQCPPEHKQELHDWIVSGIGKAVEQ